jgi:hypothetical protein
MASFTQGIWPTTTLTLSPRPRRYHNRDPVRNCGSLIFPSRRSPVKNSRVTPMRNRLTRHIRKLTARLDTRAASQSYLDRSGQQDEAGQGAYAQSDEGFRLSSIVVHDRQMGQTTNGMPSARILTISKCTASGSGIDIGEPGNPVATKYDYIALRRDPL